MVKRLGKFKANKTRPILVRFDSRRDVTTVIIHWKLVEDYRVSYDLTKFQRSQFNKLRDEAKVFNECEVNKNKHKQIVKFVNGQPKLFTIKLKSSTEDSTMDSSKNL